MEDIMIESLILI